MADPTDSDWSSRISRRALFAALQHVDEVVIAVELDGTISFASPSVRALLGWDADDFVGRNLTDFFVPEARTEILSSLLRWSDRGGEIEGEPVRILTSFGTWTMVHYDVITGPDVAELGVAVMTLRSVDLSHRERIELLNRLSNETRILRVASAFLGVGVDDFDSGLTAAVLEIAGLTWVTRVSAWHLVHDAVVRRGLWEAGDGAPSTPLPAALPLSSVGSLVNLAEVHLRTPAEIEQGWPAVARELIGGGVRGLLAVPTVLAGSFAGFVMIEHTFDDAKFDSTHFATLRSAAAIFADAFARNDAERKLAVRARTDSLTGLPNRWTFQYALEESLGNVALGATPGVTVALIDLDRFKRVNDSLGHDAGDRLLMDVAERLETAAGAGGSRDTVARLGGDEFLVLLARCGSDDEAMSRIERIIEALVPPFHVDSQPIQLTASVGVARVDHEGSNAVELLRRADLAMYQAKRTGGNRIATEDPKARVRVAQRLHEEGELRAAITGGGLVTYLQGEWDMGTGRLIGAEALARWVHPDKGLVAADTFIPMAEESDLIVSLGEHVLQSSCEEAARWRRDGFEQDFLLRVNLSARQLRQPGLVDHISEVLRSSGLPASELCLELTESALLVDPPAAARILDRIRALGCGLGIDDFGTGYSSMLYLKNLPLTGIKIDRTFVAGLPGDKTDRAIVACVVQLAESLGVTLTAEGVETEAQRQALLDLGCRCAQGDLLSAPEPMESFARRLLGAAP
ncbi:MAG: EAL domain-containing protein [Acidimicrobiales bacterium]|jgi:diguanylate cyclase (GGDEF)-like protein/PAS domain S-box-containing protein